MEIVRLEALEVGPGPPAEFRIFPLGEIETTQEGAGRVYASPFTQAALAVRPFCAVPPTFAPARSATPPNGPDGIKGDPFCLFIAEIRVSLRLFFPQTIELQCYELALDEASERLDARSTHATAGLFEPLKMVVREGNGLHGSHRLDFPFRSASRVLGCTRTSILCSQPPPPPPLAR